jgi:hypothetical protein
MRVYSSYFQGAGSYLAKMAYKPLMDDEIKSLRETLSRVRDTKKRVQMVRFMERDLQYAMEPSRDFHKIRAATTIFQLGFSPAAAFINLTQTPVFTFPYFAGAYGNGKAYGRMREVMKGLHRAAFYNPSTADPEFAKSRQLLIEMGKLETGAAPELAAYSQGDNLLARTAGTAAQRRWRTFTRTSMWMFEQAERLNREITLGMSWELSADLTHPHMQQIEQTHFHEITRLANATVQVNGQMVPVGWDAALRTVAAREAISRTQFEYSRDYRPEFLRSPLASSFLVFFSYVQAALYAFGNNPGRVQTYLTFVFLFGAMGLPGAEDLEELINAIARGLFGKDFSIEDKARELVRDLTQGTVFDETGPDLLLHGLARYSFGPGLLQEGLGIPQFDASANGSLGKVVPGLAETLRAAGRGDDWKGITAELAKDVAGAGFGQIFPMLEFLASDPFSADQKKWEKVMPRAAKGLSKAWRFGSEQEERTRDGSTFVEFDLSDPDDMATVIAQGLGFTPTMVSKKWEKVIKTNDLEVFYKNSKAVLMEQMGEAVRRKDKESRAVVIGRIKEFNAQMKREGIPGLSITADGLKKSLEQRARTRAKREAGEPLNPGSSALYRKVEELYPGVEKVK